MNEGLHSAAFSAADHVLSKRIVALEQRLAKLEALQVDEMVSGHFERDGLNVPRLFGAAAELARRQTPQPPASAA